MTYYLLSAKSEQILYLNKIVAAETATSFLLYISDRNIFEVKFNRNWSIVSAIQKDFRSGIRRSLPELFSIGAMQTQSSER